MHYETDKNNHGLPFNPFKSCVVPRPIAWISTLNRKGAANLAPFSQFNIVGWDPPYIMFAASAHPEGAERKHSVRNVQETGEFVFNMATYDLREAVNKTAMYVDSDIDECDRVVDLRRRDVKLFGEAQPQGIQHMRGRRVVRICEGDLALERGVVEMLRDAGNNFGVADECRVMQRKFPRECRL